MKELFKNLYKKEIKIFGKNINFFLFLLLCFVIGLLLPWDIICFIPAFSSGEFMVASLWLTKISVDIALIFYIIYTIIFMMKGRI